MTYLYKFLCGHLLSFFSGTDPGVALLGCRVILYSPEKPPLFHGSCTVSRPYQHRTRVPVSPHKLAGI